jgi:O-acetyl-ADP-ribose deacetylase (regulator of RNase III)
MTVRVQVGDLHDADTEVVARPVRSDGTAVTSAGRRLELAAGAAVTRHLEGLGELPVGSAVLTPGGKVAAAYILHLVLQSVEEPVSDAFVRRALAQGLERVADWGLRSLTLPPLGAGAGVLEAEAAARLVADTLREHLHGGGAPLELVVRVETDYERELFERVLSDSGPLDAGASAD